jgi:nucleotide-binding universal stress UspA family protein
MVDFQMAQAAFAIPKKDYQGGCQKNYKANHQQNHYRHHPQTDGIGRGVNYEKARFHEDSPAAITRARTSGSTLPPERTTPTRRQLSGIFRANTAAAAAAPVERVKVANTGGVVVELGAKENQLPGETPARQTAPLPAFKLKKILVPVDFSQCSQKALQYAIPFARQFDAALTLFNVVPGYLPVPEMGVVDVSLMETQMHQAAERELAVFKQRHLADGITTECVVRIGNPYHEIVVAAKEMNMDLIILSTHGRTGLKYVFMGSTAEHVADFWEPFFLRCDANDLLSQLWTWEAGDISANDGG